MSRTFFISDLHLDPARPAVTAALAEFLQANSGCDALYILGDIFEAWVGDDDDAPIALEIAELFRNFTASGSPLFLMVGNRDFMLGTAFCASVGANLLPDPTVIDLYGTPTLLMHGDSLCTLDEEYMKFRAMARSPQWQTQMMASSLEERRALAAQLRTISKDAGSNKAQDIMDVTPDEVDRMMAEANVTRLIHGHTHRPARHKVTCGERIVLGDWESKGWYVEASSKNIGLTDFFINQ